MRREQSNIGSKQIFFGSDLQKLQSIKRSLLKTVNDKKKGRSVDSNYRFKVTKIYKEEIKNVFHPSKMKEYNSVQNFESCLQQNLRQSEIINGLAEEGRNYVNQTIKSMSRKDIFQTLLTLDTNQFCGLINIRPFNNQRNPSFPEIKDQFQSIKRLPKILKNKFARARNHIQTPAVLSPLFRYEQNSSSHLTLKRDNTLNSNKNIMQSRRNSIKFQMSHSNKEDYSTPTDVISRLNEINNSSLNQKNFRMSLQLFRDFMLKRYASDLIISYFDLPRNLTAIKISDLVNTLHRSSKKQKIMITFLTFDLNKDGCICEEDLFRMLERLEPTSSLNQDIYKIIKYYQNFNSEVFKQSQLPSKFLQNPKRELYKNIYEKQTSFGQLLNFKLQNIDKRAQYFTTSCPDIQVSYGKQKKPQKKHLIKITFQMFEHIFRNEQIRYISDILSYFFKQNTQIQKSVNKKLGRKMTIQYDLKQRAKTFQLRNSNKSVQSINQRRSSRVGKNKMDFRRLRANTQNSAQLLNILAAKLAGLNPRQVLGTQRLDRHKTQIMKNPHKAGQDREQQHQLYSGQASRDKNLKPTDIKTLPQQVTQKINLFKNDLSKFTLAYKFLK